MVCDNATNLGSTMLMNSFALHALVVSLLVGAPAILLCAAYYVVRGRPYPPRRNPRRLAVIGLISGCLGIVVHYTTGSLNKAGRQETGFLSTEARFESDEDPAMAVEAPPGWSVQFDEKARMVKVIKGVVTAAEPPAMLGVDTSVLKNEADTERLATQLKPSLESKGFTVDGPPFSDRIGEAPAHGVVARWSTGELCSWVVKRGSHFVASVQCFSRTTASCRDACAPVLDRLHWRRPTDIAASDL